MHKVFVLVSAFVFLLTSSCCTLQSITHFSPTQVQDLRKSFIFAVSEASIGYVAPGQQGRIPVIGTEIRQKMSTGSGVIVAHGPTYSIILTAGHLCDAERYDEIFKKRYFQYYQFGLRVTSVNIVAFDINGKHFKTKILGFDKTLDACVIKTSKKISQPARPLAWRDLQVGETVLNIAAPASVFRPGMVPFFTGQYVGLMFYPDNRYLFLTFNFFVTGGSSGSPVFNSRGEIVTIIMGAQRIEHIPVGPPSAALRDYVYDFFRKQKEILITH